MWSGTGIVLAGGEWRSGAGLGFDGIVLGIALERFWGKYTEGLLNRKSHRKEMPG